MKSSKVEEGLLSRSMLGFQDVRNAKWFIFAHLCLKFGDVLRGEWFKGNVFQSDVV